MFIVHREGNRCADSRDFITPNATFTAKEVKIDAVVGTMMARTNAEREERTTCHRSRALIIDCPE